MPTTGTNSRRRPICTTSSAAISGPARPPTSAAAAAARWRGSPPTAIRRSATMPRPACSPRRAGAIPICNSNWPRLPQLDGVARASFDNVLCETVIMHLPRADIAPSVRTMLSLLKPDGMLYLSWRVTAARRSARQVRTALCGVRRRPRAQRIERHDAAARRGGRQRVVGQDHPPPRGAALAAAADHIRKITLPIT